jgi:haloacetate dehalogenase
LVPLEVLGGIFEAAVRHGGGAGAFGRRAAPRLLLRWRSGSRGARRGHGCDVAFFEGFAVEDVALGGGVTSRVRVGGPEGGPVVVLLHGHPRTGATWWRVAGSLAGDGFRVVVPDLRGYGRSVAPPDEAEHAQASKRALAGDVVGVVDRVVGGDDDVRFAVVGHDRGALVAFRAAMDWPARVSRLVVMDGLPVIEHLERAGAEFAAAWWHWWFMGQTDKPAETVIGRDPAWWYRVAGPEVMGREAWTELQDALRDPAVIHAMCEDYRAGLGIDRAHDAADREAGRRVACPTLVLWSSRDDMYDLYGEPLVLWRPWVEDGVALRAGAVDSGHHAAEEAPDAVAAKLAGFLRE